MQWITSFLILGNTGSGSVSAITAAGLTGFRDESISRFKPVDLFDYAGLCGWTLARAHARSGDPAMIAGYMVDADELTKGWTSP